MDTEKVGIEPLVEKELEIVPEIKRKRGRPKKNAKVMFFLCETPEKKIVRGHILRNSRGSANW